MRVVTGIERLPVARGQAEAWSTRTLTGGGLRFWDRAPRTSSGSGNPGALE